MSIVIADGMMKQMPVFKILPIEFRNKAASQFLANNDDALGGEEFYITGMKHIQALLNRTEFSVVE